MIETDILVVGGGPAGISAALACGRNNIKTVLIEERDFLGGQLIKQTHRFFGSKEERAGSRGIRIAEDLMNEIKKNKNIDLYLDARALGYYEEEKIFTVLQNGRMLKFSPRKLIIATGAFEKSLSFENNDLPGIYGAGAVQTLMNIYGVKPAERVLMIGSGNIGLIVSYQLIQAGVQVVGVIEAAPEIGGYAVHASKIRRLGVPLYTSHTIKKAIGNEFVTGAEIIELDRNWNEIKGTEKKIDCDCICLSVGLSPLVDILSQSGCEMVYIPELGGEVPVRNENMQTSIDNIYVAGDLAGIEEATAAMLEGELAGLCAANTFINDVKQDERIEKIKNNLEVLRSGPKGSKIRSGLNKLIKGETFFQGGRNTGSEIEAFKKTGIPSGENLRSILPDEKRINETPFALIECFQEIPCDPCVNNCPFGAITEGTDINNLPKIDYSKCTGCGSCISRCPGLAIFLINKNYSENTSTVSMPYEMLPVPQKGEIVDVLDREGKKIVSGKVVKVLKNEKMDKTNVISVEIPKEFFNVARNIRLVK
ncbi:MAG: hypothetical protein PWQ77_1145 [Kosmotogales bacterium]|nr:hypothetical protein [Kosmotogales bacterium]